jgi:site-specific DNA recombinase
VAAVVGQQDTAARLADLQDQIRAGENRLTEIGIELAGLGGEISGEDVAAALGQFSHLVEAMTTSERARLVELLVERVAFDREKGTVAITFRPSGFEALMEASP